MSLARRHTILQKAPCRARLFARSVSVLSGLSLAAALGACSQRDAATQNARAPVATIDTTSSAVLATIGDEKITTADVHARAADAMDQLDGQYRRVRDKIVGATLDSMLRERLIAGEAKKQGKSSEQLLVAEMGGSTEPTQVEIEAWYKDNQARTGGRSLDQLRGQIADFLRAERRRAASDRLEQRVRAERKVTVNFEPFRQSFSNEGAPTLGKKDASVTLVEFSDFQCPFCQAVAPVLKQITQKFGDQVQIVYRQYPIPSLHPFAFKAAEASLCAHDQGKFWELHDLMFQDQTKLAVSDLKARARQLAMDGKEFDGCLDSGKYVERVQNDMKEGQRIGINGTPALFVNGIYVEGGSVPFSVLDGLIQNELTRRAKPTTR